MRYFELFDDVAVPLRWHLGEAVVDGGQTLQFCDGRAVKVREPLSIEITDDGKPLDYCLSSFGVPIATSNLGAAMQNVADGDVQLIRVITEPPSAGEYCIVNATRLLECLDESRSEFTKWTGEDHRADLAGHYRMVAKLRIEARSIPPGTHAFRIAGWPVALIVSGDVREAMLATGCVGAKFIDVT